MITKKMQNYLIKHASEVSGDNKSKIKHCVYMNRMQKRIERELKMMLWLAVNYPKIFVDEDKEYKNESGKVISHRRLKTLLLTVKALNPKMEVELVLKNLDFPEDVVPPVKKT